MLKNPIPRRDVILLVIILAALTMGAAICLR